MSPRTSQIVKLFIHFLNGYCLDLFPQEPKRIPFRGDTNRGN